MITARVTGRARARSARIRAPSSNACHAGLHRGDGQFLLKSLAIIENECVSANRECYLGPNATCINADRSSRLIRIRRSAIRLLDLE
jgi:hypothetical protein